MKEKSIFDVEEEEGKSEHERSSYHETPRDEFSHKTHLLNVDDIKDVRDLNQVMHQEMALANLDPQQYQWEIMKFHALSNLFSKWKSTVTEQNKDGNALLYYFFNKLFPHFLGDLRLSRAIGGIERIHQAGGQVKVEAKKKGWNPLAKKESNVVVSYPKSQEELMNENVNIPINEYP